MVLNISEEDRCSINSILDKFSKKKSLSEIFYDMCFCICAPQTTFKSNRKVIDELIRRDFYNIDIENEKLREIIRPVRYLRKADYLIYSKGRFPEVQGTIESNLSDQDKRFLLMKIVKGFGWKASSHFLRDSGARDLAIIDTHIIKFMKWQTLPKNGIQYLAMEEEFRSLAKENNLSIAGLDAYIWKTYSNTEWKDFIF
jgi:N-glycosylase/DNA lyase